MTADDLANALATHTSLQETASTVITGCWQSKGESLVKTDAVREMLKVGQLVDVDWRVGVALESSQCKDLKEPYVTLVFQVKSDASMESQTVELSVAQFQEVAGQFKEMARLIDLA